LAMRSLRMVFMERCGNASEVVRAEPPPFASSAGGAQSTSIAKVRRENQAQLGGGKKAVPSDF
jgi:hypothetical protein